MKFGSEEEVVEHQETCGYKAVMCENEGCNDMFSADSVEHHDSNCPFKILPCEQNCSELLMRRDMDKHCITDCPMKLTNCPFYSIGCQTPVPHSLIKKHCSESAHAHLLIVLHYIHKEASAGDVECWAHQVEKSEFCDQLEARDVRTFTMAVKNIEKRIGPFEASKVKTTVTMEDTPASPPLEQETSSLEPEQEASTSPIDEGASPLSMERDMIPSVAPEQEKIRATPIEQDVIAHPSAPIPEESASSPVHQDLETGNVQDSGPSQEEPKTAQLQHLDN